MAGQHDVLGCDADRIWDPHRRASGRQVHVRLGAAEEKARLAQQAELRRSMEAEERGNALRSSDEANRWYASIVAKIERAWIKPGSARAGVTCIVSVSQVPGGEVTAVRVNSCSIDDAALRQSVENAVYSASPLPPPPNPALFERNLELTFAPQ